MKNIKTYFFDATLIVFSVLLALTVSECRSNLAIKSQLSKIEINLTKELHENQAIVDSALKYHESVLIDMDSALNQAEFFEEITEGQDLILLKLAPKGIMQKLPSMIAWETAKLSDAINEMDINDLQEYNLIYQQLKLTYDPIDEIMAIVFSAEIMEKDKAKSNLTIIRNYWAEMTSRERTLSRKLRLYKEGKNINS